MNETALFAISVILIVGLIVSILELIKTVIHQRLEIKFWKQEAETAQKLEEDIWKKLE